MKTRYHLAYAFAIIGLLASILYFRNQDKELIKKSQYLTQYTDSLSFEIMILEDKVRIREEEILILSDLIGERPNWEYPKKGVTESCEEYHNIY